jgi:hypothetical protein
LHLPAPRARTDHRGIEIEPKEPTMATYFHPDVEPRETVPEIDYRRAEGLPPRPPDPPETKTEWAMVGAGLAALLAILATILGAFALANSSGSDTPAPVVKRVTVPAATPAAPAKARRSRRPRASRSRSSRRSTRRSRRSRPAP